MVLRAPGRFRDRSWVGRCWRFATDPGRFRGRRLVLRGPAAGLGRHLGLGRPRAGRRRRRQSGLGIPNLRLRFLRLRLLGRPLLRLRLLGRGLVPWSRGRPLGRRPVVVPGRVLPTSTGPLHRGRRPLRRRLGLRARLELRRPPRLEPERRDQPAHRSRSRLVGLLVRAGADLSTRLRNVRRTGRRRVRPGGFGGLWWEMPGPVGGVGRSVHASSLVRPPGRASGPAYRGRRPSATALSTTCGHPIPQAGSGG